MKSIKFLVAALIGAVLLVACQPETVEVTRVVTEVQEVEVEGEAVEVEVTEVRIPCFRQACRDYGAFAFARMHQGETLTLVSRFHLFSVMA